MLDATSRHWCRPGFWGFLLLLCYPVLDVSAQDEPAEAPAQTSDADVAPVQNSPSDIDPSAVPAQEDAVDATLRSETVDGSPESGASPESEVAADESPRDDASTEESEPLDASETLRFSFSGTPWREVLNWLAEGADLALHVSELPTGSFTYSDPQAFTPNEAIERLNLFLIPQGYTLVRRGSMLSVISLGDPRSMQQLDAMAELISTDQLDQRGAYDVVRCIIPLGEIDPSAAAAELSSLTLMREPVVLPNSNQLMVTDTASKVKTVVEILRALETPEADADVIQRFELKHTDLENLLEVAGTHLGIEDDQMAGFDISISADAMGKRLFVTGSDEKVRLLESLITMIDVPDATATSDSQAVLRSHAVDGENLQTVYDVLQTLLAGQSMRLSMEPKTNSIVALADPSVHEEITQTIKELQAPAVEFAVVELNELDPYFAITLLSEMFDIPSEYEDDDDDSEQSNAPKIDADPDNMRLFVRGSGSQIAQIKQVIESLDVGGAEASDMRIIPLQGERAQRVLETVEKFWRGKNPLQILPPAGNVQTESYERTLHPDRPQSRSRMSPVSSGSESLDANVDSPQSTFNDPPAIASRLASSIISSEPEPSQEDAPQEETSPSSARAPIRGQVVPQGIVIQSDDIDALNRFEEHLRKLAGSSNAVMSQPVVFYLKYSNAEEAVRTLADLLDGASSLAGANSAGSLVRGGSASPLESSYYGSLLLDREGATTVTAGTATIVSDARLNRLFVQGTADDVAMIEEYLKIIDKGASITTVETYGSSHIVDLVHARAEDVAEVVREAYAGRIATNNQPGGQTQQRQGDRGGNNSGNQRGNSGQGDEDRRTPESKPTRGREPEMTIAVHESSNSLVITAPDPLFAEVEKLVKSVDVRAEQTVQVLPATDAGHVESVLMSMLGQEVESSASDRRSSRERSRNGSSRDRSSRSR